MECSVCKQAQFYIVSYIQPYKQKQACLYVRVCALYLNTPSPIPVRTSWQHTCTCRFNTQSDLHMKAANVFFISSLIHAIASTINILLDRRGSLAGSVGTLRVTNTSLKMKCVSLALACMFILSPLLLFMWVHIKCLASSFCNLAPVLLSFFV